MKKPELKPNPNRKRAHKRNRHRNPVTATVFPLLTRDVRQTVALTNLLSSALLYFDACKPGFLDKLSLKATDKDAEALGPVLDEKETIQ